MNLYQSYVDEGKSEKDAREETSHRLKFGIQSVVNAIKEMLTEGNVMDNKTNLGSSNAYEKLDQEEVEELPKHIRKRTRYNKTVFALAIS